MDRESFPDEFRHLATSLASHRGRPVDRLGFTRLLYERLEDVLDRCAAEGFDAVRGAFEARFRMAGRRIVAQQVGGDALAGTALGIDRDGALRVRCDDGSETRVIAGDVTLAKEET